ncbi:MFS transporter [Dermacoccus sp. PAMC28757]|uniref:MFS transporter n=1 Tax=Dermacoccus sp. PAMC28757 TaxID=2762331 RepID=UPI00164DBE35|nr:MFS transporter [Dermacoccus sp. PAMC28757]QNK53910.1 MFS transporter [Dermacoccus sp. PAMC28757]
MTKPWTRPAHAMLAVAWGGNEFTPLLVMYKSQHHLPAVTVDILLFAYVLGIIPSLLIGGPLSDRYGRAKLLAPAPWIAMAGSATLALAHGQVAALFAGRVLSGIALGLVMAVGTSWVKELSSRPHDDVPDGTGAKRAAMSLTAGFGIGAGVAGCLAQWAPYPDELAYVVNILVTLSAAIRLRGTPETIDLTNRNTGRLRDDLRIPALGHRRFLTVVLPVAPWVFGAAACAYAVLPALMSSRVTNAPIAFSALLCVVGLTCGFFVQSLGRKIDRPGSARAVTAALVVLVAGMLLGALAASELAIATAILGSFVLGAGYGLAMVSGLLEVQRIAGPRDLAGLTAVFYSVTYLGFAVPAIMALVAEQAGIHYSVMFLFGAAMAAACLAVVVLSDRREQRLSARS